MHLGPESIGIRQLVKRLFRCGKAQRATYRKTTKIPTLHIIAVAYRNFGQLKVFVQSWLNQTKGNWFLTVIHDGPDPEFDAIMMEFQRQAPDRIAFRNTANRFNDYGHSLREIGLREISGDYVMLTNADNYFVPKAVEFMNDVIERDDPDVVLFDMVHSHDRPGGRKLPAYSYFKTKYKRGSIDMSAAIVRAELSSTAGFRDKTHDGDATYFEDIARIRAPSKLSVVKIPRVLLVHN